MTILVTGGCGFIGSNFIKRWLSINDEELINVDKLTYAGNQDNTRKFSDDKRYHEYFVDIADPILINYILTEYKPRAIIHFAAETHVDNSILNPMPFLHSNVDGTVNLLQCVLDVDPTIKFIHVSTDEVYGSLNKTDPPFTEKTLYAPRSPYAASKAASDHFVNAYHVTYGLQTIITNCSNNYGPRQHNEKFIPTVIRKALAGEQIPVYGNGSNIRDWIYVNDHCDALIQLLERGRIGEKYNIGGNMQIDNLSLAKHILDILGLPHRLISFVEDRKGHDFRYDIDNDKVYLDIGWKPRTDFAVGLIRTVNWYLQNRECIISC
jgi:dTDP-glucose 4,6-dehydratase